MKLKNKAFIVSCQALENEELFGDGIMTKMARAALNGGADYIRTSQLHNINDMMKSLPNVKIIGLIKKEYVGSDVYITPTIKELDDLIETGVHVIAIDATLRHRPKESLEEQVAYFNKHKQEHQLLMADCSNENDVINADKLGFDIIGTTMRGYTADTKGRSNIENNYEFLRIAKSLTTKYLIGEGGLNTPLDAKSALDICDGVVVGSAITRPKFITEQFTKLLKVGSHD